MTPGSSINPRIRIGPLHWGHSSALARAVKFDIERCPDCGGRLKIIAAIEEPAVMVSILGPRLRETLELP